MDISLVQKFNGIGGPLLSSAVFNGKYYLGNYGAHLITGPTWADVSWDRGSTESILDICSFNNDLYFTAERDGGLYKLANGVPSLIFSAHYGFHMAIWKDELYFTYGLNGTDELWLGKVQADGTVVPGLLNIYTAPNIGNYLYYVAAVGPLLILGPHSGSPYDPGMSLILYTSDGTDWFDWYEWEALTGLEPIYRAHAWGNGIYLGTWPTRNGNDWDPNQGGKIYKSGENNSLDLVCDTGKKRITAFFEYNSKLYALAAMDWNTTTPGDSELWETSDGTSWSKVFTFTGDPEVSTAVVSPDGTSVIFGGGFLGDSWSSVYTTGTITPVPPVPSPDEPFGWKIVPFDFQNGPFDEINTNADDLLDISGSTGDITIKSENLDLFTPDMVGLPIYIKQHPGYSVSAWQVNGAYNVGNTVIWGQNYYICVNAYTVPGQTYGIAGTYPPTVTEPGAHCKDGNPGIEWEYLHSGFGIAVITGYTDARNVSATVVVRLPTTNNPDVPDNTYLWALCAWGSFQGWPSTTAYFQDRQLFGNTPRLPMNMWWSRTGGFNDFGVDNPVQDDNAITYQLLPTAIGQVPAIRHFLELSYLLVFTSGGIWMVQGAEGTKQDIVTPGSINLKNQGGNLVSHVPPLKINNYAIFLQEKGNQVRTLGYSFMENAFIGRDVTIMSNHLLQFNTITEWAFQEIPYSCVWSIRNDGILLSLTFLPEQQVEAWARHDTQGKFESISCVTETDSLTGLPMDSVYFIVNRNLFDHIDEIGRPVYKNFRCIERMALRHFQDQRDAYFVDCGITFDGRADNSTATHFTGADHLAGQTVSILADGFVIPQFVMPYNGEFDTSNPAQVVHVGLPYTSAFETLDLSSMQADIRDKQKLINGLSIIVDKSAGFEVGTDANTLIPYKQRSTEAYGAPDNLLSEMLDLNIFGDWNKQGRIFIRQSQPLPVTVLAVIPQVNFGGW